MNPASSSLAAPAGPAEPLSDALARGECLTLPEVLALGLQLAQALDVLHRRGALHLALRPEAVLWDGEAQQASLRTVGEPAPQAARLAYIAPEQTGRMERSADARSDLYALGILLYELLTGAPPFRCDDALAQIHWHIAGLPRPPAELDARLPAPLSQLVMKLLAKTPEERYQSAASLAQDLAECRRQWQQAQRIAPFALARGDLAAQLAIPPRLYGREREVHLLLQAFEQATRGEAPPTLLLVEGWSGIGKTALIQQLVRPIVRQQGYFISGKFDQVARGVPFGALIQAFRALVRQWLGESEAQLARWRATLGAALGSNAGVLTEVIPEIAFIVGPQAAPAALGGTEAQNRFQRVLQHFLAALAHPDRPVLLFLDDLQWADTATLDLLEPLLTSPDIRGLMLMGAWRDHELEAAPRLAQTLAALARAGVALQRVALSPLPLPELTRLVADTLHCRAEAAAPLAQLVHAKTGGNPFFVIQFLKLLEREGHLRFDQGEGCWTYRAEDIADAPLADNVIDLMTRAIERLPAKAQYALTLAACIGNRFDRRTLATVSQQGEAAAADDLALALAEGLIVRSVAPPGAIADDDNEHFAFLHDRVQQSAYALIPAERRRMVHLTVGRLLHSRAAPAQLEAGLFEVVHHLNLGLELIHEAEERRAVARLDLAAGRRAKAATAHDSALELFATGIEVLDALAWDEAYELAFDLHLEAAESRTVCGRYEEAMQGVERLLARAAGPIDQARVLRQRSVLYEAMARYAEALASTREGLALFGVELPAGETLQAAALEREIAVIEKLRGDRAIASLIDLPALADPAVGMVMAMLTDIWSAAYIVGEPTLARLISATLVRLSLEHGNAPESAYGYVTHAITVGPVRGRYDEAYDYGRLALSVNERFDDTRRRAKILQQFHAHVNLWCRPFESCLPYAREACRSGLDSGDFLYAAYGAGTEPWAGMAATQDLAQFVRDFEPSVALIEKLKNTGFADAVRLQLAWARALQGGTDAPLSFSGAGFDEAAWLARYRDNPFFACIHAVARLQLAVLLGTPAEAMAAARHAQPLVRAVPGTIWPVLHAFSHALALAGVLGEDRSPPSALDEGARNAMLEQIREAQAGLETLARHCAQNFRCQALLLAAEIARIEGRARDALATIEQAIEFAAGRPLIQHQALAHELAGRLRLHGGQRHLAALHFAQAREAYRQWGAFAKVHALEREHPLLIEGGASAARSELPATAPAASMTSTDPVETFDLFSVLKAAQAIAAEVERGALLARLMHIAIENAGAERGALVLEGEAGPRVHASDAATPTREGVPLAACDAVPAGIVHYVRRTREPVVLAQAPEDEQHGGDPYVLRHAPRSVACLPLALGGGALGVLYLEHRRAGAVFTAGRLRTLQILAAQAAIALDNLRLRDNLEAENSWLRRDLIANVSHDLRTPLVSMRGYLELLATKGEALPPAQRSEYLGVALRQSEHLATLVDELFELAKLDFRGMTLQREPFALGELAADVVQKFRLGAQQREVQLAVEAPARLSLVDADLGLIERVLDNLIGNALQHTPPGGQVQVRLREADGRVQVEVADTGAGIASADLPFVFERFYRGADRRGGGAGLGLAISKRILELHDAAIEAHSSGPDGGSRFCFSLPAWSALTASRS